MKSKAIISLADENYYNLLLELINSIQNFPESKNIKICVLDAGMTTDQVKNLENKVYSIKKAEWDIDVPFYKKKRNGSRVKFRELFYQNIFQNLTNFYGSIVMHGSILGTV